MPEDWLPYASGIRAGTLGGITKSSVGTRWQLDLLPEASHGMREKPTKPVALNLFSSVASDQFVIISMALSMPVNLLDLTLSRPSDVI